MTHREFTPRFGGHRVIGQPDPLGGVRFASPDARELAVEYSLTADDFAGHEPTRKTGYGVEDVHAIADMADEAETEE